MKKYVIALLLVLVFGLLLTGCKKTVEGEQTAVEEKEVVYTEPALQEADEAPEEVDKCTTDAVITFTGCRKLPSGNIEVDVINSGRAPITGLWYYIVSDGDETGYERLDKVFDIKETQTYEIDLNKWSSKIGNVKQVIVKPILDGKACNNQKMVAIVSQCK